MLQRWVETSCLEPNNHFLPSLELYQIVVKYFYWNTSNKVVEDVNFIEDAPTPELTAFVSVGREFLSM